MVLLAGKISVECARGDLEPASAAPSKAAHYDAGDLRLSFRVAVHGIQLAGIEDRQTGISLAREGSPLLSLLLRRAASGKERILASSDGWRKTRLRHRATGLDLSWTEPAEAAFDGLSVTAVADPDANRNAWHWTLRVENRSREWILRSVIFPQIDLADLGESGAVLFPRGPGEVQRGLWGRDFQYHGNYPDGWCSMQFMAAYREANPATGLYLGAHDPWGSTKSLEVKSDPKSRQVRLSLNVPASNLDRVGNGYTSSGEVVWQLLRGDWFDAATVYRSWARRQARWWPRLTREGRADTPAWMRELPAWVMTGGGPGECVPAVKRFRETLGLPVGFHWYNWHQVPFDNDYPHYFPTKTGFADGVAALQSAGVFAMPYINGRLWDSHDRGAEDFEFTRLALPSATKQDDHQPFLESYGSKETNGQPVRLAVMCPTTSLWQKKVREIVLRLLKDEGTRGVYIDQIAAAAPKLCMDTRHNHPAGGGHWWTEGYWELLDGIRRAMPSDCMLTTECNAEPFIRWFDGYLTWHWQHDGQVPAFPAIYGGTIQMFGRAYRGGPTQDLALRMKAGQQWVYGEQIGWFDPALASESSNFEFLKKIIGARWNYRRYFHAGEMARPPRLVGSIPRVKADWQWSGEWWVTTDAVLAGAWGIPSEKRWLLLFANVSDQAVKASVDWNLRAVGLSDSGLRCAVSKDGNPPEEFSPNSRLFGNTLEFQPQSVQVWELRQHSPHE